MSKIKTYKDVWGFPLEKDDYGCVWDIEDIRVFDFDDENLSVEKQNKIIACLNDEFEPPCITNGNLEYREEGEIFFIDSSGKSVKYMDLRGWAHMTGTLKLSSKRVVELQDQLAEFIINKLTNDIG